MTWLFTLIAYYVHGLHVSRIIVVEEGLKKNKKKKKD